MHTQEKLDKIIAELKNLKQVKVVKTQERIEEEQTAVKIYNEAMSDLQKDGWAKC